MKQSFIIFAVVSYLFLIITSSFNPFGEQQFYYLSKSFLSGRVDVNDYPSRVGDMSLFKGNYYWPLGPFPALFITPFVFIGNLLGIVFFHRYIHWVVVMGVFYLVYKICQKLQLNKEESILMAFAFNMGSVFIDVSIIPWSWYFAQVVCTLLIFLAIYEYLHKGRYLLLGIIFSCILLTRTTAFLGVIFFILELFRKNIQKKERLIKIFKLSIPIFISGLFLLAYNYIRFDNPLEQGYKYQIVSKAVEKSRSYGIVSLKHVPGNLYYFLIAPPTPVYNDDFSKVLKFPFITYDYWGMGIIFTSVYLCLIIAFNYKDPRNKNLLLTSFIISIPIFLYYGIGARQYGYRYSLDFLPYLFILFIMNFKTFKHPFRVKMLVLLSIMANIYLLFSKSYVG